MHVKEIYVIFIHLFDSGILHLNKCYVSTVYSSVYRIFTKLGHMIPLWKGKNSIYFGVIRSKVKVTITLNILFDNKVVSAR